MVALSISSLFFSLNMLSLGWPLTIVIIIHDRHELSTTNQSLTMNHRQSSPITNQSPIQACVFDQVSSGFVQRLAPQPLRPRLSNLQERHRPLLPQRPRALWTILILLLGRWQRHPSAFALCELVGRVSRCPRLPLKLHQQRCWLRPSSLLRPNLHGLPWVGGGWGGALSLDLLPRHGDPHYHHRPLFVPATPIR